MKTKLILSAIIMLLGITLFSQNSKLHEASTSHTLNHLKYAVNNRDFSAVSNYLADDYMYESMKRPMSISVLKQVIDQYPLIDSIVVIESNKTKNKIYLNVKLYNKNGPSDKKIILDSNYNLLQADIATLSLQGHGSSQNTTKQNKNEEISKLSSNKKMPFWLTETGHIVVEAEVNGIKGNYIVDNGTSQSLMLNSNYNSHKTEKLTKKPMGVSGVINNAGKLNIKSFKWNGIELENIEALTANLDHLGENMKISSFAGTIGYGILKNFIIEFDYDNKQLILWQNKSSIKEKYKIKPNQIVPMSMAFHIPILKAKIGNKEIRLGLDCGAQGNMLEANWEKELKGNYDNPRIEKLGGADNNYIDGLKVLLNNLSIKEKQYEMDFMFGNIFGGAHKVTMLDGLIGYPFLSYQKTAVNFQDNELYFLD